MYSCMSFHRLRDPGALSISPAAKDECELAHISRKRLIIVRDPIGRRLRSGKAMITYRCNHFARFGSIAKLGGKVLKMRYHRDGKIVTGAGVSASADAGLFLTREIVGQKLAERIQLGIEYYPDPPFGPKTVDEASDEMKAKIVDFEKRGEEILASIPRQF